MRVRFLGSADSGGAQTDIEPRHAIFKLPGDQITPLTVGPTYPLVLDLDGALEAVYRIRAYRMQLSYETGYIGGTKNGVYDIPLYSAAADERELIEGATLSVFAYPSFVNSGLVAGTETDNPTVGPPSPVPNTPLPDLEFLDDALTAYYYDPDNDLWLLRINFDILVGSIVVSFDDITGILGYTVTTQTATFLGTSITVWVGYSGTSLNSFSLDFSGYEWWEYSGDSGPIWDFSDGSILQDYKTNED